MEDWMLLEWLLAYLMSEREHNLLHYKERQVKLLLLPLLLPYLVLFLVKLWEKPHLLYRLTMPKRWKHHLLLRLIKD
jgi:hypothetical protein